MKVMGLYTFSGTKKIWENISGFLKRTKRFKKHFYAKSSTLVTDFIAVWGKRNALFYYVHAKEGRPGGRPTPDCHCRWPTGLSAAYRRYYEPEPT